MADPKLQIVVGANDQASPVFKNINGALGGLGTKATAISFAFNQITAAIGAVVQALKPMVDAALQMEKIETVMKSAAGSSEGAARELAFVRDEAQRLGLSVTDMSLSFAKFMIATKGTALEGEGARKVFVGFSTAFAALKMSGDEAARAFNQVAQGVGKGKIQLEDTNILAEAGVPIYEALAQALGKPRQEIMKMIGQGELMATEYEKVAEQLKKTFGPEAAKGADSLQGSINKFNDSIKSSASIMGQTATPAVKLLLGWVADLAKAFVNLVSYLEIFGIVIAANFARAAIAAEGFINGDAFTAAGRQRMKEQQDAITQGMEQSFADLEKKYGVHQQNMSDIDGKGAANAVKSAQIRRESARKTGDDLVKIEADYAKEIGTIQQQLTAEYDKSYQDRKKALTAYYDQLKASANSNREEEQYEKMKKGRLLELEKQHAQDVQLVRLRSAADAVAARKSALDQEQAAIEMQAARGEITAFEAERRITALTVAAAQDNYQAKKAVADKAREIYGQDSAEYRARLKEMESAHSAYTSANLAAYKKYSNEIKKIDQDIADFRLSIQQKIADLQQRGMTDGQKYADNQKRFDEAVSKSREALARGDYETAQKYAKQAEELATRLADKKAEQNTKLQELETQHQQRLAEIAKQSTGSQSEQQRQASEMARENADYEKKRLALMAEQKATTEGITNATAALNTVEQLGVDILEAKKKVNVDALAKLKEIQDFKLDPKNLPVTLDEGALGQVRSQIAALTKDETKTIYIRTVEKKSAGGMVGMSRGGKLPGESLIDSIPVLARPGEWFIRNESARVWGDGFMQAINAPFSAAGQKLQSMLSGAQRFSTGGQVQAADMGSITINVGSAAFPVQGQTSVLTQLKQELRREQMRRPQ